MGWTDLQIRTVHCYPVRPGKAMDTCWSLSITVESHFNEATLVAMESNREQQDRFGKVDGPDRSGKI